MSVGFRSCFIIKVRLRPRPHMMTHIADAAIVTFATGDESKAVILSAVKMVDNHRFFKVAKSDGHIVKLLTGRGVGQARQLRFTDVIEDLILARNAKWFEVMNKDPTASDDLGLDEAPRPKRMKLRGPMPETFVIDGPGFGDVQSAKVRVVAACCNALWLELTAENVDYLRALVGAQIADGVIRTKNKGIAADDGDEEAAIIARSTGPTDELGL